MQTGVLGVRRGARVDRFWNVAWEIFMRNVTYWRARSSAEQGAATLALAEVDVRLLPLPPSFNARESTTLGWLSTFGDALYHGHLLWRSADPRREAADQLQADLDRGIVRASGVHNESFVPRRKRALWVRPGPNI